MTEEPTRKELEDIRALLLAKIEGLKNFATTSSSLHELNTIDSALKQINDLLGKIHESTHAQE